MSTYTINKSDGSTLVTVPEATINTTACSLALVGRRAVSYGEPIAENFVKLVENFAHSTAPASPLDGQLWFDTGASTLKLFNNTQWANVVNISGGGSSMEASQFISTATTGTPPLVVASTTKVTNLNADFLDGYTANTDSVANTIPVRDSNADIFANVFQGTATSARYADLAERFASDAVMAPGEVVELGGAKEITKATIEGGSALGVVSTNPAIRMNEDAGDDASHPFVAFTGRVPCRVMGLVAKGDRLAVSATPGVARKANDGEFVIGRALEDKLDAALGEILIVVGVK